MNRVQISGNLTKDIELKKTTTGKSVCNFAIGVRRNAEETDFIFCEAWNQQADYLATYARKGDKVLVDGSIRVNRGQERSYTTVVANSVELWSRPREEQSYIPQKPQEEWAEIPQMEKEQTTKQEWAEKFDRHSFDSDDLPFM